MMKSLVTVLCVSFLSSVAQASPDPILECKMGGGLEGITKITVRPTDLVGQLVVISETENTKDAAGEVLKPVYNSSNGSVSDQRIFVKRVTRSVLGYADLILVRGIDAQGAEAYRLESWFTCNSEDPDLCVMSRGQTSFEKAVSASCRIL